MQELLIRLGELSVGFLGMMGPLVLLIIFLKLRDERESNLYTVVLKELNSPDLRGLFALKIRCSVFSKQDTIMVDLWSCSKEQVWDIVIRLTTHLPPEVRLVVNSMTDFRSRSTLKPRVEKRIPSVRSVSFCRYE